jgi:hypothetical protein
MNIIEQTAYCLLFIIPIELMDEDLRAALFDEEGEFEELDDDFVAQVSFSIVYIELKYSNIMYEMFV